MLSVQAGSFKAQTQGQRASGRALLDAIQPLQGLLRLSVAQGPTGCSYMGSFHGFFQLARAWALTQSNRSIKVAGTQFAITQGVRAFSSNQMRQDLHRWQMLGQGIAQLLD